METAIYEMLLEKSEVAQHCTYEDYMCNQPMRDGEEMRNFFDEINLDGV